MAKEYYLDYQSKIGWLRIGCTDDGIFMIKFTDTPLNALLYSHPLLETCFTQLDAYFRGQRKCFSLPLTPRGTLFQMKVWQALQGIPFGELRSYRDIALALGNKHYVRAVGNANNKNPLTIVVPCHRVIGSNGRLVGYGGGLWRKEWLLLHEKAIPGTMFPASDSPKK